MKTPNLNPEAMSRWIGANIITWCKIEDDRCLAMLVTGAIVNVIGTDYSAAFDLPIDPLGDLCSSMLGFRPIEITLLEPWAML